MKAGKLIEIMKENKVDSVNLIFANKKEQYELASVCEGSPEEDLILLGDNDCFASDDNLPKDAFIASFN